MDAPEDTAGPPAQRPAYDPISAEREEGLERGLRRASLSEVISYWPLGKPLSAASGLFTAVISSMVP